MARTLDRAYLGGLERQTENPTVDLLNKVAGALSVSVSELFTVPGPDDEPPKPLRSGRRKS